MARSRDRGSMLAAIVCGTLVLDFERLSLQGTRFEGAGVPLLRRSGCIRGTVEGPFGTPNTNTFRYVRTFGIRAVIFRSDCCAVIIPMSGH